MRRAVTITRAVKIHRAVKIDRAVKINRAVKMQPAVKKRPTYCRLVLSNAGGRGLRLRFLCRDCSTEQYKRGAQRSKKAMRNRAVLTAYCTAGTPGSYM